MTNGETRTDNAPTKRWWKRWMTWILAASLALNLFVLGWAGVRWAAWGWGWHHFGGLVSRDHGYGGSHRSDPGWELARHFAVEHGPPALAVVSDGIPHLLEAADALEAEPFNPARLDVALLALEETGHGLVGLAGVAARDGAARLSPENRARIAKRIRRSAVRFERRLERWEGRLSRLEE